MRYVPRLLIALVAVSVLATVSAAAQKKPSKVHNITLTIDSTTYIPNETPLVTKVGESYLLEVSGFYTYSLGGRIADAEFAFSPDDNMWLEELPGVLNQSYNLDLLVNGTPRDWLGSADGKNWQPHTYSQDHVYRLMLEGDGEPLSFNVYDSSYDWNAGSLTVSVSIDKRGGPKR